MGRLRLSQRVVASSCPMGEGECYWDADFRYPGIISGTPRTETHISQGNSVDKLIMAPRYQRQVSRNYYVIVMWSKQASVYGLMETARVSCRSYVVAQANADIPIYIVEDITGRKIII